MYWWRTLLQLLFTLLYGLVSLVTLVLIVPVVEVREWLQRRRSPKAMAVLALLVAASVVLGGCTVSSETAQKAKRLYDRSVDFAQTAPPAPYAAVGDVTALEARAAQADLFVTGQQLALIAGAADLLGVDKDVLAFIINAEIRDLDEDELERDVLGALAGEDTSIGIAQVKLSTALLIESENPGEVFTSELPVSEVGATTDAARTERIRRLAADDWSILYAASYLSMIEAATPSQQPLDAAKRYRGLPPTEPTADDVALLDTIARVW